MGLVEMFKKKWSTTDDGPNVTTISHPEHSDQMRKNNKTQLKSDTCFVKLQSNY